MINESLYNFSDGKLNIGDFEKGVTGDNATIKDDIHLCFNEDNSVEIGHSILIYQDKMQLAEYQSKLNVVAKDRHSLSAEETRDITLRLIDEATQMALSHFEMNNKFNVISRIRGDFHVDDFIRRS